MPGPDPDGPRADPKKRGDSGWRSGLKAAGSQLSAYGSREMDESRAESSSRIGAVSYKKGGRVKRTGLARLHKGEYVVPRGKVRKVRKAMRKGGRS